VKTQKDELLTKKVWEGSDAALNTHKKEETCTLK
jgi:hypothetical protein